MRLMTLIAAVSFLAAMSPDVRAQRRIDDLKPGVPESLATARAQRVSDVRYRLSFNIPANRGDRVPARATITFALANADLPLALDFEPNATGTIRDVTVAGARVAPDIRDGHLILPSSALRPGANVVAIDFDAGDAPLN